MHRLQWFHGRLQTFHDRYPLIGPVFWIVSVQYFVTQLLVAWAWSAHYSLRLNTISDLGNTVCGQYGDRFVCSPGYTWMNASFIVLGATMIAGASLIYQEFRESRASAVGFSFMALGGLGTILVGLFPENVNSTFHFLGAALPFVLGNAALVLFSFTLGLPRRFRYYTVVSALVGLVALLLFYTKTYLGLEIGGMERLVAYPQTIWLIAFGLYMSRNHSKRSSM